MNVHATIDGLPVNLTDWQCDATVNHGDRSCSGKIPEAFTSAEQEAPIILWQPNGDPLWQGKLALDPVTERGKRSISARGYAEDISADAEPLLYRHDGGEGWSAVDEDPHNYDSAADEEFTVDARPGRLAFFQDPATYAVNDRNGMLFWAQGSIITKYTYTFKKQSNLANFEMLVRQATGPNGTPTTPADGSSLILTSSGGPASGTLIDIDLDAGTDDMVLHFINCNTAASPTLRHRFMATQLRVYGRTTSDAFGAHQVVEDVADGVSFGVDNVQANALAVLPIYWREDHADLLTYIAALTDWHWEAYGPEIHFGPWETTWTASITTGARPTWENQPRYNTVAVPFTSLSGVERIATATADDDPFPGQTVTFTADALDAPQPNDDLADAVAANLTAHYASRRVGGRLELGRVTDATGRPTSGAEVRPGHLITIPERADLGPQRVVGMNYREAGDPVAEINSDFNVVRLLNSIRVPKKKKPKRSGVGGPVR